MRAVLDMSMREYPGPDQLPGYMMPPSPVFIEVLTASAGNVNRAHWLCYLGTAAIWGALRDNDWSQANRVVRSWSAAEFMPYGGRGI